MDRMNFVYLKFELFIKVKLNSEIFLKNLSKNICVMNVMTQQETFKPEVNTILF